MLEEAFNKDEYAYRRQQVELYRPTAEKLAAYLPWLEAHRGMTMSQSYTGQGIGESSVSFPVYDSTLLAFVKLLQASNLMDRNYHYVYSRNRIRSHEDEVRLIRSSELKDIGNIKGILSKYTMEGMRKGTRWTEAVASGIFYECVAQLKKDIEYWDVPISKEG